MVGINTEGGAAIQGDANTRDLTGRDRYNPQQLSGSSVTFQNPDSAELWRAILQLGNQLSDMQERLGTKIAAVDFRLDELPSRVRLLELKVDPIPIPVPLPISFPTWLALSMIVVMLVVAAFFAGRIL